MSGLDQLQASNLARKGRYGDDAVMHVSRAELSGLDNLARHMTGQPLSVNPETGMKEAFAFLPMLAPFISSAIPALATMGPMGAALTGAGLGALEASIKGEDPLTAGLLSGVTAGAGGALMGNLAQAGVAPGVEAAAMKGLTDTASSAIAPEMLASVTQEQAAQQLMANPQFAEQFAQAGLPQGFGAESFFAPAAKGAAGMNIVNPLEQATRGGFGQTMSNVGSGVSNIMSGEGGLTGTEFLKQNILPIGGVVAGSLMGGSLGGSDYGDEEMKDRKKKSEAEEKRLYDTIRRGYAEQQPGVDPYWLKYAQGGSVATYPMQTGGFVMTADAVRGAGGGDAERGLASMQRSIGARPVRGPGTGKSDSIPATIDGTAPARLSNKEAYVPPKKVKENGGSNAMMSLMKRLENRRKA